MPSAESKAAQIGVDREIRRRMDLPLPAGEDLCFSEQKIQETRGKSEMPPNHEVGYSARFRPDKLQCGFVRRDHESEARRTFFRGTLSSAGTLALGASIRIGGSKDCSSQLRVIAKTPGERFQTIDDEERPSGRFARLSMPAHPRRAAPRPAPAPRPPRRKRRLSR